MDPETLNLINKYREYNPEYDRYTDQEITQLGLPGFEQPMGINTIPNQFSYRNQFMTDLKNLPSDFRTSLGQTKDAFLEDISGLTQGLGSIKDSGMNLFGSGMNLFGSGKEMVLRGIGSIVGGPIGSFIGGALGRMKESPTDKFNLQIGKEIGDQYGYKSALTSGTLGARQDPFGRNLVSMFGDYEKNRMAEVARLSKLQDLNKFQKAKLDFGKKYLEKVKEERAKKEAAQRAEFNRLNEIRRQRDRSSMSGGVGETLGGTFGSSVNDPGSFSDYS